MPENTPSAGEARPIDNHFEPSFPRVIDYTILSDWKSCPHKFFRSHVCGMARSRPNIHLHFGGAVATGLEAARRYFLKTGDTGDALEEGCLAVVQAWGSAFDDFTPVTRTERNKSLANALLAIQAYFREWPLDEDELTIHHHQGQPCVEFSFALPIPGGVVHPDTGEPLLYAGRFDFIGDYSRSIYGCDDKTASVDPANDSWRQQWKLRGQFSGYCWAAREYGMPMHGFFVRGMGVMTDSVRTGQCIIARPPWMVDAWLRQMQDDVSEMCNQYALLKTRMEIGYDVRGHAFPQSFADSCADFGGCSYLDLCASEHPEDWYGEYVERRWNPLTREEA